MKLSDILKPEDVAELTIKATGMSAQGQGEDVIKKLAEIVAVTTANRLGVTLEIDEW